MKLKKIYDLAVKCGKFSDPRGAEGVEKELIRVRKKYDDMTEKKKLLFDKESLVNPFSDTRILYGTGEEDVKTILVGVDMEVGEVVLADRLREKGKRIDLVLSINPM